MSGSVVCWMVLWGMAAFGYFGLFNVLFNLYLLRLGFGPEFIGLLLAAGQLLWGVAALPSAAIGRRFGLRSALVLAYALMGIGFGLLLLVELLPRALWQQWLFGWFSVVWIGASLATVNSVPYLVLLVDEKDRKTVFPMQQAVTAATTLLGSLAAGVLPLVIVAWFGGSLADAAPYRDALWPVPLLFLAGIPLLYGTHPLRRVETHVAASDSQPLPLMTFLFLGTMVFLQMAAEGPVRAFFNVYLDRGLGVAPAQIGLTIGAAQALPVVGALLTTKALARWGATRTQALSSSGTALALLLLAGVPVWAAAGIGFMGVMTMSSMNAPSRSISSQELVAPRWRGTTSAVVTIATAVGWATMAAAGGYIILAVGFGGLFALSAALAAAASAVAWAAYRLHHRLTPVEPVVATT